MGPREEYHIFGDELHPSKLSASSEEGHPLGDELHPSESPKRGLPSGPLAAASAHNSTVPLCKLPDEILLAIFRHIAGPSAAWIEQQPNLSLDGGKVHKFTADDISSIMLTCKHFTQPAREVFASHIFQAPYLQHRGNREPNPKCCAGDHLAVQSYLKQLLSDPSLASASPSKIHSLRLRIRNSDDAFRCPGKDRDHLLEDWALQKSFEVIDKTSLDIWRKTLWKANLQHRTIDSIIGVILALTPNLETLVLDLPDRRYRFDGPITLLSESFHECPRPEVLLQMFGGPNHEILAGWDNWPSDIYASLRQKDYSVGMNQLLTATRQWRRESGDGMMIEPPVQSIAGLGKISGLANLKCLRVHIVCPGHTRLHALKYLENLETLEIIVHPPDDHQGCRPNPLWKESDLSPMGHRNIRRISLNLRNFLCPSRTVFSEQASKILGWFTRSFMRSGNLQGKDRPTRPVLEVLIGDDSGKMVTETLTRTPSVSMQSRSNGSVLVVSP